MRPDMTKVIIERPRAGGSRGQRGNRRKGDDPESLPFRESSARGRKRDPKGLTDLLGPLERFLAKNVGRPWDRVYSEIREHVHPRKQVELHILDHVRWFVEKDVIMVGKVPHRHAARNYDGSTELWAPFYVHPLNGLLCKNPYRRKRRPQKPPPRFLKIDDSHQLWIVEGVWYEVTLQSIWDRMRDGGFCEVKDVLTGQGGSRWDFRDRYGGDLYAAEKRQLSRKEIKLWRPAAEKIGLIPK